MVLMSSVNQICSRSISFFFSRVIELHGCFCTLFASSLLYKSKAPTGMLFSSFSSFLDLFHTLFCFYAVDLNGRFMRIMRIWNQHRDVVLANWHLGFTAFGGPPVQFQTVRPGLHMRKIQFQRRLICFSFTSYSWRILAGLTNRWSVVVFLVNGPPIPS